jgi:hypothetical protein
MTREEYAKKYQTNEIIRCFVCKKEIFRTICSQKFDKNGENITTCSKECGFVKIGIVSRRNGVYSYENMSLKNKKGAKTKQENGFWKSEKSSKRTTDGLVTRRKNGYYKSEKFRDGLERREKLKREHGYYDFEYVHNKNLKTANTLKEQGFYSEEKSSERAIKGHSNRTKNSYTEASKKCFETMKKNGTNRRISIPEIALGWLLCLKFGHENVFHQIKVDSKECNELFGKDVFRDYEKSFTFDYVVKYNNKTFAICPDGIHYHGLDRPIIEIARDAKYRYVDDNGKIKKSEASIIFGTYYRDRYFENFVRKTNVNVLRFTDINIGFFSLKNKKLEPYFTNGFSDEIENVINILNKV